MLNVKNDIGNNREVKKGNLVNYQLRTQRTLRLYVIIEFGQIGLQIDGS